MRPTSSAPTTLGQSKSADHYNDLLELLAPPTPPIRLKHLDRELRPMPPVESSLAHWYERNHASA